MPAAALALLLYARDGGTLRAGSGRAERVAGPPARHSTDFTMLPRPACPACTNPLNGKAYSRQRARLVPLPAAPFTLQST